MGNWPVQDNQMIFLALNFVHFLEQITYCVPRPVEDDGEGTALNPNACNPHGREGLLKLSGKMAEVGSWSVRSTQELWTAACGDGKGSAGWALTLCFIEHLLRTVFTTYTSQFV